MSTLQITLIIITYITISITVLTYILTTKLFSKLDRDVRVLCYIFSILTSPVFIIFCLSDFFSKRIQKHIQFSKEKKELILRKHKAEAEQAELYLQKAKYEQ